MITRILTIAYIIVAQLLVGQSLPSAFNEQSIQVDSSGNYAFIVSGHFHGSGTNRTGYPTNSLLANLDWINKSESNFVICLGDLFLDVSHDIPFYEKSFFSKLNLPLYNAVGNHDLTDQIYQDHFGKTYYYFEINGDTHIILDTELDDGSIEGEQLKLLQDLNLKFKSESPKNIFIYSHRTIWSKHYSELDGLFGDNTQSVLGNNFKTAVQPLLNTWVANSNVYWFSGSLGNAPASFFHFKDDQSIIYIATAIRGLQRDAVLKVSVSNGKPEFTTKSFTGQELQSLEAYNVEFWKTKNGVEPFNFRLVPYYLKSMLSHRYFWYGVIFTILIVLTGIILKRMRKSTSS